MSQRGNAPDDAPVGRLLSAVDDLPLFKAGEVHVSRAPGRLDVMGGIADYTGSLVCQLPLAIAAAAAVQWRGDQQAVCQSQQASRQTAVDMSDLKAWDAQTLRQHLTGGEAWARYILGCQWWLMHHTTLSRQSNVRGVSILVDSDVPLGGGVSSSAAIEVATMQALASLQGVSLPPMSLAAACQQVENLVVGAACGVMDQVASTMGQQGAMLKILCQPGADGEPAQVIGTIRIPEGCTLVGLHSGVSHEVAGDPYTQTRVAAFMAQRILEDYSGHTGLALPLANRPLDPYEQTLRAQLPVSMKGQSFIERWNNTHDAVTTIEPHVVYHVRAAADHHVREMHRVERFAQLLGQDQPGEADLLEAGRCMMASHESYTQNARLGHPLTDRLASLLEEAGLEHGIYGQRITGGGGGGTLAILMRDTPRAHQTLARIRRSYETETGRTTQLFTGSSPGAAAFGIHIHQKAGR